MRQFGRLAATLARPGGNVTGISILFDGISAKLLELAIAAVPKIARPAILYNSANPGSSQKEVQEFGVKQGLAPLMLGARTPQEVDEAFAAAARERADALLAMVDPFIVGQRARIAQFGLQQRLPTFAQSSEFVESGCLASYGPDFRASFRRAAYRIRAGSG